jgi:hypothetical protein
MPGDSIEMSVEKKQEEGFVHASAEVVVQYQYGSTADHIHQRKWRVELQEDETPQIWSRTSPEWIGI